MGSLHREAISNPPLYIGLRQIHNTPLSFPAYSKTVRYSMDAKKAPGGAYRKRGAWEAGSKQRSEDLQADNAKKGSGNGTKGKVEKSADHDLLLKTG